MTKTGEHDVCGRCGAVNGQHHEWCAPARVEVDVRPERAATFGGRAVEFIAGEEAGWSYDLAALYPSGVAGDVAAAVKPPNYVVCDHCRFPAEFIHQSSVATGGEVGIALGLAGAVAVKRWPPRFQCATCHYHARADDAASCCQIIGALTFV